MKNIGFYMVLLLAFICLLPLLLWSLSVLVVFWGLPLCIVTFLLNGTSLILLIPLLVLTSILTFAVNKMYSDIRNKLVFGPWNWLMDKLDIHF